MLSEVYASLYNLDVLIAKPSNLIGPGHSAGVCSILAQKIALMEQGKEEKKIVIDNLLAQRDFLDVRDAIKGYEILFLKGKSREVYDLKTGNLRNIREVVEHLKLLAKVDFEVNTLYEKKETIPLINSNHLKSLGWRPLIPFEQSMKDILDFQRSILQ
ncbi:NAD-dependent epimerase/dehydratase family protein [Ureibacillus acetophenoni]